MFVNTWVYHRQTRPITSHSSVLSSEGLTLQNDSRIVKAFILTKKGSKFLLIRLISSDPARGLLEVQRPTYALQGRVLGSFTASSCNREKKFHLMLTREH